MPTFIVNQVYLGRFTDLDPVESSGNNPSNVGNELTNASNLGSGPNWQQNNVFDYTQLKMVTITQNDTIRGGKITRLEENDRQYVTSGAQSNPDSFTYDLGASPITVDIDSTFVWTVEITLRGGATQNATFPFIQLVNGDIFTNNDNLTLDNMLIRSIKLLSPGPDHILGATNNLTITNSAIVCFVAGTRIRTERGEIAIEDLAVGDLVETLDHGFQPLRWIGSRRLGAQELAADPRLRPVRIRQGSLGLNLPMRDLLVSPQHRIMVSSSIARRMFGNAQVLGAAKQFLQIAGIDLADDLAEVTYFHLLFDRHEIIFSEGALTESLFTGPMALEGVSEEARAEIIAILPDAFSAGDALEGARPLLPGRTARKLAMRHLMKGKPLLELA